MTESSTVWEIDSQSLAAFTAGLSRPQTGEAWLRLRRAAEDLALLPAFDRLITLDMNRIEELPHQIRVAHQVLQEMGGRAILADEVGLGKTIEAGIILKELAARGLARRVVILTPASLVTQWVEELSEKFFEEFTPIEDPDQWGTTSRAVASYDRARQEAHSRQLLANPWDLVIVDEAHKCKNEKTGRYKLISSIRRNYLLLLTATPIQNDLRELYNLVTLLRPGHLGTWREFKKQYVVGGDFRNVKQAAVLKELTSKVMVRTRRSSVADIMKLPPRYPKQPELNLTTAEEALYQSTATLLRDLYQEGFRATTEAEEQADRRRKKARSGRGLFIMNCIRLAQRLCSSAPALADSLAKQGEGELILPSFRMRFRQLADQAKSVQTHAKLEEFTQLLRENSEQVVVFSEHLPTIDLIADRVRQLGRPAVQFSGELGRIERARALKRFKQQPSSVLVSTRAGTEGLNLQFCNQLVNYELPWNPMVVEQRIGRIHRFGQLRPVYLYNYAAQRTVEAHILRLLHTKIRLFELVIGELDMILDRVTDAEDDSFEGVLGSLWLASQSDEAFEREVEKLGDRVAEQRQAVLQEEQTASGIAADDAAAKLEREFSGLPVPARLRLGYGTVKMLVPQGVEGARKLQGLHVGEILEMLASQPVVEPAGASADYGPLYRVIGTTSRGRAVTLLAQADRLPLVLVDIITDPAAPLAA